MTVVVTDNDTFAVDVDTSTADVAIVDVSGVDDSVVC